MCRRFRQSGLERGDKIAFLMNNGLFTAQLFLGTMYGGFVSVPLNARAGVSQLSYMLDHCDAKVVFVESQYAALIQEVMANVPRTIEIVSVDTDALHDPNDAPCNIDELASVGSDDAALLMYSSGTTGQPKGAVHTHKTILAHGNNSILSHKLTAADRSLLVLPLYHINAECVTLIPTPRRAAVPSSYRTDLSSANFGTGWTTIAAPGLRSCRRSSPSSWIGRTQKRKVGQPASGASAF